MDNLQQDFLNQSIASLENLINQLQNEPESFSENFWRESFRTLHTIKGTSQTLGFPVSGNIAHELENLLAAAKNRQILPDTNYKSLLLEGLAFLRKTFEQKDFVIPDAFAEKLRKAAPNVTAATAEYDADIFASEIPAAIYSHLSRGEKTAGSAALKNGKNIFCLQIELDLTGFAEDYAAFRKSLAEKCEIIAAFPVTEIVPQGKIGFQILVASSENIEEFGQKNSAEIVFQTVENYFSNDLPGIVAQLIAHGKILAKQFGKQIEIDVTAGKNEVLPKFLKTIFDILLHLIRNAVDHAIELPEERVKKNKQPQGKINIFFSSAADGFNLAVSDDGRGIDAEKILAKAIEKKLISKGETLSEQEIIDFIFQPEFSTAAKLSKISGRGIGLDAVKNLIEKTGGKITVTTQSEKGTTFEIYLPNEK